MVRIDRGPLKELGLTNNEIEVYLALLTRESATANGIAEMTGLHRQACYDALDRLLQKELVSFVLMDSRKHFQASPPKQLVSHAEELKERLREMLPQLDSLAKTPRKKNLVELHRGKDVLRGILRDVVDSLRENHGEVLVSGVEEDRFLEYDRPAMERYINDMRKFGLHEKLLATEGAKTFFPGKQSQYRFIRKEHFNPNPTFIYGDKVVFLIWGTPLYGIMIRNQDIADANRKQFDIVWGMAKKASGTKNIKTFAAD
jgi:sugar-specific transcriptional regulator TrmB